MRAEKRRLRAALSARRLRVEPAAGEAAAARAADRLAASEHFNARPRLALYAALPDELPTRALYERGRRAGKRLLWPRVVRGGRLEFAACARWEDLEPGRYGVPAPPAASPAVALGAQDLLLVPAVAFDREGRRLGRGRGYYDRALAATEGALAVAVGYDFQLVEAVPTEPHDRRVDAILTEARWLAARAPGERKEADGSP